MRVSIGGMEIRKKRKSKGISDSIFYDLTRISSASLSRIERGTKDPNNGEIHIIAEELGLDEQHLIYEFEKQRTAKSINLSLGQTDIVIPVSDALDYSRSKRMIISENRAKGDTHIALKQITILERQLKKWMKDAQLTIVKNALLLEQAHVLWQKVVCYSDSLSGKEACKQVSPIIDSLKMIDRQIHSDEVKAMILFVYQGLYYLMKNNKKAIDFRIENYSVISEPFWRLAAKRVTASCMAYVGNDKEALREINDIKWMIDCDQLEDPFTVMWGNDAIGRVYAVTKNPKTFNHFQKAWDYVEKIKVEKGRSRLREAQLASNHLRAVYYLDPSNISLAEELERIGLEASKPKNRYEMGQPRHVQEIQYLMGLIRNKNKLASA